MPLRTALADLDPFDAVVRVVVDPLLNLPPAQRRDAANRLLTRRRSELRDVAAAMLERDGVDVPVGHLMADDELAAALAIVSAL